MARRRIAAEPEAPAKPTIGDQIDAIWEKREQMRTVNAHAKKLKEEVDVMEEGLIAELKALKLDGARGSKASVAKSKLDKAKVNDWPTFYTWIAKTKNWQVLIKRANDASYREIVTMKGGDFRPPGTEMYTEDVLSLRSL
jgi:hypothetical protein